MSDEEKVSSLFDLEYHQTANIHDDVKSVIMVTRVPNGWIYTILCKGGAPAITSSFVPEYIPGPPQQKDDSDHLLDAEICDFLNEVVKGGTGYAITANKLIRALLKRQKGE